MENIQRHYNCHENSRFASRIGLQRMSQISGNLAGGRLSAGVFVVYFFKKSHQNDKN